MIGFFRRDFWMADGELAAKLAADDQELTRRERARRSNDDIVMPFRRDGELVAGFAAVPGVVAVVLLIVAVVIR
ncbi:hypothetical protein IC744_06925 [Microbacterium hominis]|uniref:hypothetical protein n=1 Tax=Microbacterium hominis TaxID=162426 RepID=UPI00168BCE0B|nr:hypothetical protein [Microbacterium hominis]QOC26080.1 hypothetical protein IC745_01245 [Microbacterium hominis]QOC30051.1 hypothetical protein IC744_06925 [Microbacterium hominis]